MYYRTWASTGRPIPKYDEDGNSTNIDPTDLVENPNCEICKNCQGKGCEECDFEGYIDWSDPTGMN